MEVHVLASGSDGNCSVVVNDDEAVMVDAGLNNKTLCRLMNLEGIDPKIIKGLVITHEHSDHVSAARVFCKNYDVPIYTAPATFDSFDHGNATFHPIEVGSTFELCGMKVDSLPTSHDAVDPTAYSFSADGKRISIITDTGILTKPCQEALRNSDVAILEANYDHKMLVNGPYSPSLKHRIMSDHGHLCNDITGRWIADTATDRQRKIFLAHLSRTNNTSDLARETVSRISGIPRMKIDCLDRDVKDDTRCIKL